MNPITNSPIKEEIRLRNENVARSKEQQIRNKLNSDLGRLVYRSRYPAGLCVGLVIGSGLFLGIVAASIFKSASAFFVGAELGAALGVGGYIMLNISVREKNSGANSEKLRLEQEAEKQIRKAYEDADRLTVQQINAYDRDVTQHCQRVLQKANAISPMVLHNTDMFQRMVSHADAGSNMRFIESDFTFTVTLTGITYRYQSHYTNPQDDFNFDKQRFRNLNTNAECEGLAQALAKLTIRKMMSLYPPNSLHISVSHVDAAVTMHFKAANKNFVAAQDIY